MVSVFGKMLKQVLTPFSKQHVARQANDASQTIAANMFNRRPIEAAMRKILG
jgi:hypothetical protein